MRGPGTFMHRIAARQRAALAPPAN